MIDDRGAHLQNILADCAKSAVKALENSLALKELMGQAPLLPASLPKPNYYEITAI